MMDTEQLRVGAQRRSRLRSVPSAAIRKDLLNWGQFKGSLHDWIVWLRGRKLETRR